MPFIGSSCLIALSAHSLDHRSFHLVGVPIKRSRLVLDRNLIARHILVLAANEVADLLLHHKHDQLAVHLPILASTSTYILSLLNGRLVVLRTLAHESLLDHVDALVKVVLVLLALAATTGGAVDLVANAAEEAAAAAGLLATAGLLVLAAVVVVVAAAATHCVLDEVHDCCWCGGVGWVTLGWIREVLMMVKGRGEGEEGNREKIVCSYTTFTELTHGKRY